MESLVWRLTRHISRKEKTVGLEEALENWVAGKGYRKPHRTVNETAGELGTDGVRLHHYFMDRMHVDFRTWRTRLRLEDAKRLLMEEPEAYASDIGLRVGFSNRSNFARQFRAHFGCTPAEWRKKARMSPDIQASNDYECLTKD